MPKKKKAKTEVTHTRPAKRFSLIVAIVFAIAIAGILIMRNHFADSQRKEILKNLSQLDFTGMESPVISKIQELLGGVNKHPDSSDAWGKLAMNLDAADLRKESIAAYLEAASLDPSDFRWPYFRAIALSQMGSEESILWFERAYKTKPDYVPLIVNYADALFRYGKIDQAAEKYKQAFLYDPKAAHAYFGLAQISFSQGNLQTARTQLQKAFESDPSYGEACNLLATVCRRMNDANCAGQTSAAAKDLPKKNQLIDPIYAQVGQEGESSLWHRARGAEYMKQKSYDAAIAEFQKAIQIRPDVQTQEDLAQALISAGKYSEAVNQYQSIVHDHPTARNYFGLALAYAKMGSYDRAEESFRRTIEENPDFAEAYFNLAVLFAKTGRLPETIENLRQAVRVNPDYTEAHYHLALAYLQARDRNAALGEYDIVVKLDPNAAKQLQTFIQRLKTE